MLLPRSGDEAVMAAAMARVDGLLLTGGGDVVSLAYGEEPDPKSFGQDPLRDAAEFAAIRIALERGLPVLGICRGIQSLNVALGGTLVQDVLSQVDGVVQHYTRAIETVVIHTIDVEPDTLLARVLGVTSVAANSWHHQAVKDLGEGLRVNCRARDGVIEGIEAADGRPVLAVQCHPENIAERWPVFQRLFDWLVAEAGGNRHSAADAWEAVASRRLAAARQRCKPSIHRRVGALRVGCSRDWWELPETGNEHCDGTCCKCMVTGSPGFAEEFGYYLDSFDMAFSLQSRIGLDRAAMSALPDREQNRFKVYLFRTESVNTTVIGALYLLWQLVLRRLRASQDDGPRPPASCTTATSHRCVGTSYSRRCSVLAWTREVTLKANGRSSVRQCVSGSLKSPASPPLGSSSTTSVRTSPERRLRLGNVTALGNQSASTVFTDNTHKREFVAGMGHPSQPVHDGA